VVWAVLGHSFVSSLPLNLYIPLTLYIVSAIVCCLSTALLNPPLARSYALVSSLDLVHVQFDLPFAGMHGPTPIHVACSYGLCWHLDSDWYARVYMPHHAIPTLLTATSGTVGSYCPVVFIMFGCTGWIAWAYFAGIAAVGTLCICVSFHPKFEQPGYEIYRAAVYAALGFIGLVCSGAHSHPPTHPHTHTHTHMRVRVQVQAYILGADMRSSTAHGSSFVLHLWQCIITCM
jgi:hypothetical protein